MLSKLKSKLVSILMPSKLLNKSISGIGNTINININSCKNVNIKINGNNNSIHIGSARAHNLDIFIKGNNNSLIIEDKVFYKKGNIVIADGNGLIEIGRHTTLEDVHLACTEPHSKIMIGTNCMFANGIDVRTGDSHSILDKSTMKRINPAKDVLIGNHVWVGAHSSILKGSKINDHSIVATRSVVTKLFNETNVILAGIPAKIIKNEIIWDRKRIF